MKERRILEIEESLENEIKKVEKEIQSLKEAMQKEDKESQKNNRIEKE